MKKPTTPIRSRFGCRTARANRRSPPKTVSGWARRRSWGESRSTCCTSKNGWATFTTKAKSDPKERLDHLPEPWRKHASRTLPVLRGAAEGDVERTETRLAENLAFPQVSLSYPPLFLSVLPTSPQ